jgi:hypothetical protein
VPGGPPSRAIAEIALLCGGFAFAEAPRWERGRLWVADARRDRVVTVSEAGEVDEVCRVEAPLALRIVQQERQEYFDAVDHTPEVDVDDPSPVLVGQVLHPALDCDAGVVADHVDVSEAGERERCDVPDRFQVTHVGADADEAHGRRGRIEGVLFDVGDDDLHAFRDEPAGHGEADAARAAGDDSDLASGVGQRHGTASARWLV